MSMLTEAVIHVMSCSRERLKELQEPIPSDAVRHQFFIAESLRPFDTSNSGGRKVFCNSILVACFNYVGPEELLVWIKSFEWKEDDCLVMSIAAYEYNHQSVTWVNGSAIETRELEPFFFS